MLQDAIQILIWCVVLHFGMSRVLAVVSTIVITVIAVVIVAMMAVPPLPILPLLVFIAAVVVPVPAMRVDFPFLVISAFAAIPMMVIAVLIVVHACGAPADHDRSAQSRG